jgi:hypothetical protein
MMQPGPSYIRAQCVNRAVVNAVLNPAIALLGNPCQLSCRLKKVREPAKTPFSPERALFAGEGAKPLS